MKTYKSSEFIKALQEATNSSGSGISFTDLPSIIKLEIDPHVIDFIRRNQEYQEKTKDIYIGEY